MARTENEIILEMGPLPDGLADAPNTELSGWRKTAAKVVRMFELLFENFEKKIDGTLSAKQYGSRNWYKITAMAFQLGDTLLIDENGAQYYELIDPEKQIIAQCSVTSSPGTIRLKVAKSVDGNLTYLTNEELQEFTQYMLGRMPFGIDLVVVSGAADHISISADVYVSDTVSPSEAMQQISSSLIAYRDSISFEGLVVISDVYAALSGSDSVVSCNVKSLKWKAPEWSDLYTEIIQQEMYAGYFNYADMDIKLINTAGEVVGNLTSI